MPQSPPQTVQRWALWEITVPNTRGYSNPFTDVALHATFIAPSGRRITVSGFYDGEQRWRVRWMPDETGHWRYEMRFSDGSARATGGFRCTPGKLHGPLRVRKQNPLWFEHADGTPFYMRAFHLWNIDVLDERTLNSTLDWLKKQGFNTIVGPHLHPQHPVPRLPWEQKRDGQIDFTRFHLPLWQNMDRALRALSVRGMVLVPFSLFGGTNEMPRIPSWHERELFLRYWVARWGGFWNATFQPTSEWEEGFSEQEVQRIGAYLYEQDNRRHLISVHSLRASSESVQRATWYAYHTVQDKLDNYNPTKYTWFVQLYRRVPKPILAHECLWEGNFYQREAGLDIDNLRRAAWVIALCGGQINYADEVVPPRGWQRREDLGKTFSERGMAMQPQGRFYTQLKVLGDFMTSLPFWRMSPHPEMADTGICLADERGEAVVFAPQGGRVRLELSKVAKEFTARWFDPREAKFHPSFVVSGGDSEVVAPRSGDWVLHIRRSRRGTARW